MSQTPHPPAASPGAAPAPAPPAPKPDPAAAAAAREASQAASIGAQVILDYNSDGGVGARGGAAGTIEENTALRDAHYIALGLNPAAPSGPPTGQAYEPPVVQAAAAKHAGPTATKVSSLAAGIQEAPAAPPPPAAH